MIVSDERLKDHITGETGFTHEEFIHICIELRDLRTWSAKAKTSLGELLESQDIPCRFDHERCCQEHMSFNGDGSCHVADARLVLESYPLKAEKK